jgi:hypothetical protein
VDRGSSTLGLPDVAKMRSTQSGSALEEASMAKGQMRGNKEVKKPKKKKEAVANPAAMAKGLAISTGVAKKKP